MSGTAIPVEVCQANLEHGVSNLLSMWSQADAFEKADGLAWYALAHDEAVRISELYSVPLLTVVQVACALSPRLSWSRNMPAAEGVIRWFKSGGYVPSIEPYAQGTMKLQRTKDTPEGVSVIGDDAGIPNIAGPTKVNIVKALWILQGHVWVLRGPKVASFLDNILNHATSTAVTVDSHATQAWLGEVAPGTYAPPATFYEIIAADYRKASAMVGVSPLQFQAVVWIVKKRLSGSKRG